jgi:hypothetical protein
MKYGKVVACGGGVKTRFPVIKDWHRGTGKKCPDPEKDVCHTHACPTPAPTPAPTPSPTPYRPRKPILNIIGSDRMVPQVRPKNDYLDQGATCLDDNGDASNGYVPVKPAANLAVSQTGAGKVDLSKVGTYHVRYSCKNKYGVAADVATRIIYVVDTQCPYCDTKPLLKKQIVEASFPYTDLGLTCHDNSVSSTLKATATGAVNVERTGQYVITYRVRDSNKNWNDDATHTGCKGAKTYKRTVVVQDTLRPIVHLKHRNVYIQTSVADDKKAPENNYYDISTKLPGAPAFRYDTIKKMMSVATPMQRVVTYGQLMTEGQSHSVQTVRAAAMAAAVGGVLLLGYFVSRQSNRNSEATPSV